MLFGVAPVTLTDGDLLIWKGGTLAPAKLTLTGAYTFTAAQTINLGGSITGYPAVAAGGGLVLYNDGTNAGSITSFKTNATAGAALALQVYSARGNGTTATATQINDQFFSVNMRGYGATAWSTAARAAMTFSAAENWTDAAQGTYWQMSLTTIGGTTTTIFAKAFGDASWQIGGTPSTTTAGWGGGLAIGKIGVAGDGLLQLLIGTTKADGVSWDTNTNLYATATTALKTDASLTIGIATASTSTTTGALINAGGFGCAGDAFLGGKISLSASGTTSANGITWTDTSIYRSGASTVTFAPAAATDGRWNFTRSTGENFFIQIGSAGYFGTSTATAFAIQTNGASAIIIDASQNSTFYATLSMDEAKNMAFGTTTGTKIGTGTTQKIGFWNATPVVRPSGAAQAAVATTAATNVAPYGYTTAAQADGVITLLNEVRNQLTTLGLWKGAA